MPIFGYILGAAVPPSPPPPSPQQVPSPQPPPSYEWPPHGFFGPNTYQPTYTLNISGSGYGDGTYVVSSSSGTEWFAYKAFDKTSTGPDWIDNDRAIGWQTDGLRYRSTVTGRVGWGLLRAILAW